MDKLTKRLQELFSDEDFDRKDFIEKLELNNGALYYIWKRGAGLPNLKKLDKIAIYFNCSMEFLFGRTEDCGIFTYNTMKSFDVQLKQIMIEKNVTKYKMIYKDKICTSSHFQKWFKKKSTPTPETVIKLADYFGVTIDYLLGRE